MRQLFLIFIFSLLFDKGMSQFYNYNYIMIRFPCDTCQSNHNPLSYIGGNIISAEIIHSTNGNYLKLVSGSTIDTNAVPAYFDMYAPFYKGSNSICSSLRAQNLGLDLSSFCNNEIKIMSSLSVAGFRFWLGSSSGNPGPGESTYQTDPNNSNSAIVIDLKASNSLMDVIYSLNYDTPVWKDWQGRFNVNSFGFTALAPNTEYDLYEINIGSPIVSRLASYDCTGPGAVMKETLKDKVKIYPLPASEIINIDLPLEFQNCHIELYSDLGKMIHEGLYFGPSRIGIENLPKGIYLLKVTVGEMYFVKKIIKE